MGKRLAIKGHPIRGNEVIEILEMLGGVNGKINKKTGKAVPQVMRAYVLQSSLCTHPVPGIENRSDMPFRSRTWEQPF